MNNLNLLFDYRGYISNLQFKRGIYILCIICGLVILFHLFRFLDYYTTSSNEWFIEEQLVEIIFKNFIPSFIQFGFILFYSSFVLVIKRGRSLGFHLLKSLIYALFVFLFFVGIPVIVTLITYFFDESSQENFPLVYIFIAVITTTGCIIIFYLSKENNTESKKDSPSISKINYRKASITSIVILLSSITYYIIRTSQELQFTIIEKVILENTRDLIIFGLATWLIFRIMIPNSKYENTKCSLFDNQIIKLLFDWKGSITKREFWCGIIIICISIFCYNAGTVWDEIKNFLVSNPYEGEDFMRMRQLQSLLIQFIPSFFPYACIIFYSSILICIKRCRALHINTLLGYGLGISVFFCIVSINISFEAIKVYQNTLLAGACMIGFGITFLLNIIGIIILSQNTNNDYDSRSIDHNTTSYIINNGWLILGYIFLRITINFINHSIFYDSRVINQSITYLIYIGVFIYLSKNRLQDAGLNKNWSLIIVSVFLAYLMTHYSLYEYGFFTDSPINFALAKVTILLITKIMVAFFFVLFLLPTKKRANINTPKIT